MVVPDTGYCCGYYRVSLPLLQEAEGPEAAVVAGKGVGHLGKAGAAALRGL